MKPDWDELGETFENSKKVLIGDVDCTTDGGKPVCERFGVEGYPTIKYFNPPDREGEKYEGDRSLAALKKFAKSLGPQCTVDTLKKCSKKHYHQSLVDGRAAEAARYPTELCRAICRGMIQEKKERQQHIRAVAQTPQFFYPKVIDLEEFHDREEALHLRTSPGCSAMSLNRLVEKRDKQDRISEILAWDDLTNMRLDAGKIIEARQKEIQYIRDKKVYQKVSRREARAKGWKVIQTRWIDINKGDDSRPNYRSRLVGKEFNTGEMDGIFAGTPPLEVLRCLLHSAATIKSGAHSSQVIMVNDVARAFFEAPAVR